MHKIVLQGALLGLLCVSSFGADDIAKGEKIFLKLCWGCHHQSADAFGPSFSFIANKRSSAEIKGQIVSPDTMYQALGYKRNSMPAFALNNEELDAITVYIESFK